MRVLVCGGRKFTNYSLLCKELNRIKSTAEIDLLIQGGAQGADTLARRWAASNLIATQTFFAEWSKYGKSAGPIRNKQMLDESKPDLVIAFPGGKGTANMVQLAIEAGVPVRVIKD